MGPGSTGPLGDSPLDEFDTRLTATRERYPDWDFYRTFSGYIAVPAGAVVFMAMDLDRLAEKISAYPC
jgi:hypothetical protein